MATAAVKNQRIVTLFLTEAEATELRGVLANVAYKGMASSDLGAAEISSIAEALDGAGFSFQSTHWTGRVESR